VTEGKGKKKLTRKRWHALQLSKRILAGGISQGVWRGLGEKERIGIKILPRGEEQEKRRGAGTQGTF